jgi:hypothetical protein
MTEKTEKNYFTQSTELAIIRYNNSTDQEERNKIYREEIHYPLYKLTQNLIHTFKFYYTEETNLEDLQHEVITFILTKLNKFDPTNGAKAYSYFGTIAKRYLIASNQKNYKKKIELLSLEHLTQEQEDGEFLIGETVDPDTYDIENEIATDTEFEDSFLLNFVQYCNDNIYQLFPREEDAQIADAILELFRKKEKITIFNKKALYIYIREIIDVKTPKITKVANELANLYQRNYNFYLENGYTTF